MNVDIKYVYIFTYNKLFNYYINRSNVKMINKLLLNPNFKITLRCFSIESCFNKKLNYVLMRNKYISKHYTFRYIS